MAEFLEAVLLGVVQGLTEFLPISSSGHLALGQYFLGLDQQRFGLAFNVAVHLGTLLAVITFFWRDLKGMAYAFVRSVRLRSLAEPDGRIAWLIIVATLPAVLVGYLFEGFIETTTASPWAVTLGFVLNGGFLITCEALTRRNRQASKLSFFEALGVGAAQAVGLLPGISRSGATMAMGIGLNLRRQEAARFSFLMSIPIIAGAGLFELEEAASEGMSLSDALLFGVGFATSAIAAYVAIKLFLSFVADHSLRIFAYYSFGLAAVVVAALLLL